MVDLDLVMLGAEARPAVVAQREAIRDGALDGAEALTANLAEQVGGGEAVHPQPGSAHASPLAWSIITNTAQRPSIVQPSVASVAHSVSGTGTLIVPSCSLVARLRLVQTPRRRNLAHTLRCPSPTNGELASTSRISASSS